MPDVTPKERARRLTVKQETFAFHAASGLSYADAYRQAYNAGNMSPDAIRVEAARLKNRPSVALAIEDHKRAIRAETGINAKRVTEMFLADRTLAHDAKQAGAAVSATTGIAKVNGLLDRVETATSVSLIIEQAAPRDIAKAILRIMAQAVAAREAGDGRRVVEHQDG